MLKVINIVLIIHIKGTNNMIELPTDIVAVNEPVNEKKKKIRISLNIR